MVALGFRKKLPYARVQQLSNVQNSTSPKQPDGSSLNHKVDASSNQDTSQINNESERRGRGPRRGRELQRMNDASKKKLEVCINPIQGRPPDKVQSSKLSSEIGIVYLRSLCSTRYHCQSSLKMIEMLHMTRSI